MDTLLISIAVPTTGLWTKPLFEDKQKKKPTYSQSGLHMYNATAIDYDAQ